MISDFPVIHAVTDSGAIMLEDFGERALSVMRALGPRGALHLRSSRASGKRLHELASTLASFQRATGCWLIVNDRVDIAAAVGARGAQLASHSLSVREARRVSPSLPVGISVHSVDEAVEAENEGASWCVAGTVFETPSHEGRPGARSDFIRQISVAVKIPIIAIGGILPNDIPALRRAGAYGFATIRGADWEHRETPSGEVDTLMKTRLPVLTDTGFLDPITRYISAYDSESGSDRDDHSHGQRNITGAGAE